MPSARAKRLPDRPRIGWREWVRIPELSSLPIKAKVDTGARTSALHAFGLELAEVDGETTASFQLHPVQRSEASASAVRCPVVAFRRVRSSTGHAQVRPVIRAVVQVGEHELPIELTLTPRDDMGFRLLLGRAAIRRRFLVDPGASYLHDLPPTGGDDR